MNGIVWEPHNIDHIRHTNAPQVITPDGDTITLWWKHEYTYPNPHQAGTDNIDRGLCADLPGVPHGTPEPFLAVAYAHDIPYAWNGSHPVRINGIAPEALTEALNQLADTARAYRTYQRARDARIARTIQLLEAARNQMTAARDLAPGAAAYTAFQNADAHRRQITTRAIQDGLLDLEQIATHAGLSIDTVYRLAELATSEAPTYYLSLEGFADRLGISYPTIKSYRSTGVLPQPDITLGGSPGWTLATADRFAATRRTRTAS